jgi:segregation and condensation protein A
MPLTVAPEQGACRVQIDVFDGPLDLLLHLVREQQLDIATMPLAVVAEQYLAYVSMMEELDVEMAAEYLVIAATLLFLKSKALLPPIPQEFMEEDGESAEEVEERLRRRLIAYSKYRDLGEDLRTRQYEASGYFVREAGDPSSELVQRYRIDAEKLSRAFIAMLREARPEKRSIMREKISVLAQMDYIVRALKERGEVYFIALCRELGATREIVIATFLAILELVRRHRIAYEQPEAFDDIRLLPITRER